MALGHHGTRPQWQPLLWHLIADLWALNGWPPRAASRAASHAASHAAHIPTPSPLHPEPSFTHAHP